MIDDFVGNLQRLQKADSLIARIWLKVVAYRLGLFAFASLIAVVGLGMANVAGFYALLELLGPVWAAAVIATADFVFAAIAILVTINADPNHEFELAFDARKTAVEAIQADAHDLKIAFDAFGQDIRDAKATIAEVLQNPLDAALQKLLVPAVTAIITGLRSKKDQG